MPEMLDADITSKPSSCHVHSDPGAWQSCHLAHNDLGVTCIVER